MNLLARHVAGALLRHAFVALAALLAVFSVLLLGEELRDAGVGRYDTAAALRFVLLTIPAEACRLVPAAALLGAVIGLGRLADAQELIAVQAAGVAPLRVTLWALLAGAVFAALGTLFAETVASPLACRAQEDRAVARSGGNTLSTGGGLWTRDGERFVHVGVVHPDGSVAELSVFELRGLRLERYTRAARGRYAGGRWQAGEAVQIVLDGAGADPTPVRDVALGGLPAPEEVRRLSLRAEDLPLGELAARIDAMRRRGENPFAYRVAFWQRAGLPVSTLVMVLAAVPLVLTRARRLSSGRRALAAVLLGLGLQMLGDTVHQFGLVYGLHPLVIAFIPVALVLALTPALFRALRPA